MTLREFLIKLAYISAKFSKNQRSKLGAHSETHTIAVVSLTGKI